MHFLLPALHPRLAALLTGTAVIALSSAAAAQDTGTPAGGPIVKLDPITIIANIEDPQSTFGSAYVLTERELEKFESSNVNSILRAVPGVYVREEDGLGSFPRIGIRASSSGRSDRISVLEDGVPAAMAPYANTSAYFFPNISRISAIEVLKGPEVLLYGPQTTSGAINLISTPIPSERSGFMRAEVGDYNTRRLHAYYGGTIDQVGFLLETYQGVTDGHQRIDRSSRTAGNDIEEYLLKLRWTSQSGAQQLDFKAQYIDGRHDVSYLGLTDEDFRADPNRRYGLSELERMNSGRTGLVLRHHVDFSPNLSLSSTAYWTDTHRHYRRLNQINGISLGVGATGVTGRVNTGASNAALIRGILHGTLDTTHPNGVRYGLNFQEFTSQGVQTELKGTFQTGGLLHDVTFGARYHEDETRNVATESNPVWQQRNGSLVYQGASSTTPNKGEAIGVSFWLADRISVGGFSLLPILRYEDIETRANVALPASARYSLTRTTLGLGVNYAVDDRWTLLGGAYQGFAPPGSGASEGTKGEESTNWEAGVRYRQGGLGLDVIGFYTDYSNALRTCLVANPCNSGAVEGTEQSGSKAVYGLEVGLFATAYKGQDFRIPVRLAYTWTDGEYTRASDVPGGVQRGDVLEYTPPHTVALQVGLEHDRGWDAYASLNFTDGACVTSTCGRPGLDNRYLRTDSLFTADISTSYDLTSTVEVYAKVDNLFDERAITHRGADGARGNPGRYAGLGLRMHF